MNFEEQITLKSDQELIDIYTHSEQYQPAFVNLAYAELNKRGVDIQEYEKLKAFNLQTHLDDFKEKPGDDLFITLGLVMALLGGLVGIVMGFTYSQSTRISPTGEKLHVYDKPTRDKGRLMIIIGFFSFVIFGMIKLS